jgi:hypothetical protein
MLFFSEQYREEIMRKLLLAVPLLIASGSAVAEENEVMLRTGTIACDSLDAVRSYFNQVPGQYVGIPADCRVFDQDYDGERIGRHLLFGQGIPIEAHQMRVLRNVSYGNGVTLPTWITWYVILLHEPQPQSEI